MLKKFQHENNILVFSDLITDYGLSLFLYRDVSVCYKKEGSF